MGKFILTGDNIDVHADMDPELLGALLELAVDEFSDHGRTDGNVTAQIGETIASATYRFEDFPSEDMIPREQRRAAALILSAIDLPAPAADYALHLIAATDALPGATTGDVPFGNGRLAMLAMARDILNGLLAEKGAA